MPRVFISHSTHDRDRVEREIITPLRARGIDTWYSKDDIRTAGVWEKNIRAALNDCDWFLVVLTPAAVSSEWVQTEVHWALDRRPNRVVPVLMEDCHPEELHLKLLRLQHLDLRQPSDEGTAKLLAVWDSASPGAAEPTTTRVATAAPATAAMESVFHVVQTSGRFIPKRTMGHSNKGSLVEARDQRLDMPVAVRVVEIDGWPEHARTKLVTDTRAALRFQHPAVVRYVDVIEDKSHVLIVMELIENARSLTEMMWASMTPERSAELLSQLASGLHYLHSRGLVHRWLRPGTVLVDDRGPHLTDLGFEAAAQAIVSPVSSPTYAAPELLSGEISDGRSDIYSVGVILYEMLTGRRPFEQSGPEVMLQSLRQGVTPPRQLNKKIPVELERICVKCLSLRTAERYATAADLSNDLRTWKEREPRFRLWPFS